MPRALSTIASAWLLVFLCATASHATDRRHPGHEVVYSQPPTTDEAVEGYWSLQMPLEGFYCEVVDDFVVDENCELTHVHWWGMGVMYMRERALHDLSIQRVDWDDRPAGRQIVCAGRPSVGCGTAIIDSTYGGPTNVDTYDCVGWNESGPEHVYRLVIPADGANVTVTLTEYGADLDLFLLEECDENTCIEWDDTDFNTVLNAGYYYLVVDGYEGDAGKYMLQIGCTGIPASFFAIRFYEDIYTPARDTHEPGDMLYETWIDDGHKVAIDTLTYPYYRYWADIPPFPVADGQRYWIGIQAYRLGLWFWGQHSPVENSNPHIDHPDFGVRWTSFPDAGLPAHDDMAFELSKYDSPVRKTTWGAIKGLYRR
ncbi:MAG: hypothetical protein GF400_03005 [Candidatus Eisenbacteria bacterium]|nr:hypothetical protein [Candidatus Eisenbacteria bacterium]